MTIANPIDPTTWQVGRTDQGVDFTGSGGLFAVGSGTIVTAQTHNAGWDAAAGGTDPGGLVVLKLDNPIVSAGQTISYIYYAEGLRPLVSVGQHVNAGDSVAVGTGNSIEIGPADPNNPSGGTPLTPGPGATPGGQAFLAAIQNVLKGMNPTGAGTSSGASGTFPWPSGIPAWEKKVLEDLDSKGQLFGVPPQFLAYIAQAESGFKGATASPTGGFFGLTGGSYPAGSTSPSLLSATDAGTTTDTLAFAAQAILSASLFAQLQTRYSGNVIEAVNAYVLGPNTDINTLADPNATTDSKIFAQYLGSTVTAPGSSGGVQPGLHITAADLFGPLGTLIGDVLSGAFWKRIGLFALGAGLVLVGVYLFVNSTETGQKIEGQASQAAGAVALAAV